MIGFGNIAGLMPYIISLDFNNMFNHGWRRHGHTWKREKLLIIADEITDRLPDVATIKYNPALHRNNAQQMDRTRTSIS